MEYNEAKLQRDKLEAATMHYSKILQGFLRLPNGLTVDAVKQSPEWKAAYNGYNQAWKALRNFNGTFVKKFAKELRLERESKRALLQSKHTA